MARGVPQYTTGTLGAAGSATLQMDAIIPIIETALTAYTSNATQAWELYDDVDPLLASRNRIYKSVGDRNLVSGAGDTALFAQFLRATATTLRFRTYQDWSDLSSTGSRQSILNTTAFTATAAALNYFIFVNEYEFHVVLNQSTTWVWLGWMSPVRTHISPNRRGVAFTTAAASSGSSVVVSLDRDITSSIVVGQEVWTQNVTASGNALESATIQVVPVENVTATTITLSLSEGLASGALIGADSAAHAVFGLSTTNSSNPVIHFTNFANGTYTAQAGQSGTLTSQLDAVAEAEIDPQLGSNLYKGSKAIATITGAPNVALRGETDIVTYWGQGAQADPQTDEMFDVATGNSYKYFGNLLNGGRGVGFRIP